MSLNLRIGDKIRIRPGCPYSKTPTMLSNQEFSKVNHISVSGDYNDMTITDGPFRIGGNESNKIYAYGVKITIGTENGNRTITAYVDESCTKYVSKIPSAITSSSVNGINGDTKSVIKNYMSAANNNSNSGTGSNNSITSRTSSPVTTSRGASSADGVSYANVNKGSYSPLVNDPTTHEDVYTLSLQERNSFLNNKEIKQSIFNMGIVDRENRDSSDRSKDLLLYNKFDRNGCVDPYNGFIGSKEYVFFTRPDLHLFTSTSGGGLNEELLKLPFFEDCYDRYPHIFNFLQSSCLNDRSPFITLLTNTISSPVALPDINMQRPLETGTNAYGTKIGYHGTSHPSDEDLTFTTEFTDNRYLEVFMLFKLYDEYERQKVLGWITPRTPLYTIHKILSDQISIFKIVVGEDGESILYYCKWTGCYPISVPTDSLSDMSSINGNLNISIQWHAQFFDDFDKDILQDFNTVVINHVGGIGAITSNESRDIKLFDPVTGMSNGEWANYPYIAQVSSNGLELDRLAKMRQYKLKWR